MPALAAAVVLACAALAAVGLAAGSPARPSVTISAPRQVIGGTTFVVSGRSSGAVVGPALVQVEEHGKWRTVARAPLRGGHFKAEVTLREEGTVSLRVSLGAGGRSSVRSASRRIAVRGLEPARPVATPIPAAPVTANAASAAPEAPSGGSTSPGTPPTEPPASEPPPTEEPPAGPPTEEPHPVHDYYWGAWFDGNPSPEDTAARQRFEGLAGKPLSILEAYSSWASCPSTCAPNVAFPKALFEKIRAYGAIPMYSWASEANGAVVEPDYELSDIISGRYDAYVKEWAEAAKAWKHPFFLRFDWEMNGTFFPWGEGVNGNKPGEYVEAWQHVHKIFTSVGATNVTWLWAPFANPGGNLPATTGFYPGDSYVDWTGIDGYNRGNTSPKSIWRSFKQVFGPDYAAITALAPSKPMLLPEVASAESGGPEGPNSKATWIRQMFAELPTAFPDVRGFLWFDHEESDPETGTPHGWPIESSAAATEAFADGLADPHYLSNTVGALPDGQVPVPPG